MLIETLKDMVLNGRLTGKHEEPSIFPFLSAGRVEDVELLLVVLFFFPGLPIPLTISCCCTPVIPDIVKFTIKIQSVERRVEF
jgi:hypothetical protein